MLNQDANILTATELRKADLIADRAATMAQEGGDTITIHRNEWEKWVYDLGAREGRYVQVERLITTGKMDTKQEMTKEEFRRRWPNMGRFGV